MKMFEFKIVWQYGKPSFVTAGSLFDALVIGTAERIKEGLRQEVKEVRCEDLHQVWFSTMDALQVTVRR